MIAGNGSKVLILLLVVERFLGSPAQRYEKFNFTKGSPSVDISFPISSKEATFLRDYSNSTSVVVEEEDCKDVDLRICEIELKEKRLFPPTHPEDVKFWPKFKEVVNIVSSLKNKQRNPCKTDPISEVMPAMTELWRGFGILDVAEAVNNEFQGIYHKQMISDWIDQESVTGSLTGSLQGDDKIIPKFGLKDFIRGPLLLGDMITYAIRAVAPCNFSLKWKIGRARPEEIAFKLLNGRIDVPRGVFIDDTITLLEQIDFKTATEFTPYDEGSPTHPSWPAMHSASSAASFWLDVVMELTPEQRCEARMLDYSVSFARTVAGVHYTDDNISGLMVGQGILAQLLPTYLRDVYGADEHKVKKKIERARYDWTTFVGSKCYNEKRFRTVTPPNPLSCFTQPHVVVTVPSKSSTITDKNGYKCLHMSFPDADIHGYDVSMEKCNGKKNQLWIIDYEDKVIKNAYNGKCLDVNISEKGKNILVWECHGGKNQKFVLNDKNKQIKIPYYEDEKHCLTNRSEYNDVFASPCKEDYNQQFYPKKGTPSPPPPKPTSEDKKVTITNKSERKCLEISAFDGEHENVYMRLCNGKKNQLWIIDYEDKVIKNAYNGKCLDVITSGKAEKNVVVWICHGRSNQKFDIDHIDHEFNRIKAHAYQDEKHCLTRDKNDNDNIVAKPCTENHYQQYSIKDEHGRSHISLEGEL